jgi:nucleoid-associated protein YgaU
MSNQLVKAQLDVYGKYEKGAVSDKDGGGTLTFMFNPASLKTSQELKLANRETNQQATVPEYQGTSGVCLTIPEAWFDTYEKGTSVRTEYIDKLERLMIYKKETHVVPVVVFVWGKFTASSETNPEYVFFLKKLDVEYTMFLPDGTPVRAKVTMALEQLPNPKYDKQSPDHAKLRVVKQGDTLQSIAFAEYDDPGEWRRIAASNNIVDPMDLRPGMRLLVPPILK